MLGKSVYDSKKLQKYFAIGVPTMQAAPQRLQFTMKQNG
jgi:hypothetical protein